MVQELAGFFFRVQAAQSGIPERQLTKIIQNYLKDNVLSDPHEAEDQARDFIDYCSGRAWVISKIGTEKGERMYGFTHRTFMEYFAAKSLVRECSSAVELAERLRAIIGNSQSEIIPQIALQVYEEQGSAGGADECLNSLVFNSKFGNSADRKYLWFGLKVLQFISVKPVTASRIFLSSISAWAEGATGYSRVPEMILLVASDTASNFRSTLVKLCASVTNGSENPIVLVATHKFAAHMLTLVGQGNSWIPVLSRVIELYRQSLDTIIREDPEYAALLVVQYEMSFRRWASYHGISGLLVFKVKGQLRPGLSVQAITDSLVGGSNRNIEIAREITERFDEVITCDAEMFSLWLEMLSESISRTVGLYPRIFNDHVGTLLYLACLGAIEEEGNPDRIPGIIRRIVSNWAKSDIIKAAANARRSESMSERLESFESLISVLQEFQISMSVSNIIRAWVVNSGTVRKLA
jgi:hypothetical protein